VSAHTMRPGRAVHAPLKGRLVPCSASALLLALFALNGCRLDMHLQPKYNPEVSSTFFSNGSSAQPPVEGTVASSDPSGSELLYTGRLNGVLADTFPFPITAADLQRGQERFDIYCSPCHGYAGYGDGMIVQRGFLAPPSYHSDRLRQAPAGHFFEVITNGFGRMYSYRSRVAPDDRWRIVAYIRALQLSQHAPASEFSKAVSPSGTHP
jgi:mono/diheme cytochrome c family protein